MELPNNSSIADFSVLKDGEFSNGAVVCVYTSGWAGAELEDDFFCFLVFAMIKSRQYLKTSGTIQGWKCVNEIIGYRITFFINGLLLIINIF